MNRWCATPIVTGLVILGAAAAAAQTGDTGHGEERFNTRLVGVHDLQARSAYQPLPVRQGTRRILYVGHHAGDRPNPPTGAVEPNGTSVVDVSEPTRPAFVRTVAEMGRTPSGEQHTHRGVDGPGRRNHRELAPEIVARDVTAALRPRRGAPATQTGTARPIGPTAR